MIIIDVFVSSSQTFLFQVHILEGGEVCVEFIKRKGQDDLIMEVLYISGNGQQVLKDDYILRDHI